MDQVANPFFTVFDETTNELLKHDSYSERKLSDMQGYYLNENNLENKRNETVYSVYMKKVPSNEGELLHAITIINPGTVNDEFFMTKGHYHFNLKCAEIYICQKGTGIILLQHGDVTREIIMKKGIVSYIPAGWGHRTVNVSMSEPLVFLSVWPGNSGYDYEKSKRMPFKKRVFREDKGYIIKNM